MNYFLISILILYIYYFIIEKNISLCSSDKGTEGTQELFSQVKKQLAEIKKAYKMYVGLKEPDNPEERCHPVKGNVGAVINKAIDFCG